MPIRVSIVEDNAPLRQIMVDWVKDAGDMEVVRAYPDAETALDNLPRNPPDVVLMDINLPGESGIDCVRQLKQVLPETQFVMVTVYMDADRIFQALAAGATGYLLKRMPRAEMLNAIRDVYAGGSPMSRSIARLIVGAFQNAPPSNSDLDCLSEREMDVLRLLARGLVKKEIAIELGVSFNTVHTLVRRIYDKLQVHTRREAVARFREATGPSREDL